MGWIKLRIEQLRKKHNTVDPYELASLLNIMVIPFNLHEEINGFYQYNRRNKYIFINSNIDDDLKRVVCAHELGHALLHTRSNTHFLRNNTFLSVDKIEIEANTFAAELLLSDDDLRENTHLSLQQIASLHNVPVELVKLKCKDLFL
ncbi:ImmA/IrrE family metallo-endopeptidase [Rummeliibacillus sp. NPDC094406]|uniref:ImmA/IrrE family metallo-endopeptidase n=1 Tax=Rummeliibacillus sp. NPDC094406 TaxID=3364511 RepID=UPI00382BD543